VVNASNNEARLGGGVSGALAVECGPRLQAEMKEQLEDLGGALDEGDCLVTSAGSSTRFKHVLHVPAVDFRGPKAVLGPGGVKKTVTSMDRIRACTEAALRAATELAKENGRPMSVTFPLLGAGAGALTPAQSVTAMVEAIRDFFHEEPEAPIEGIVFAVPEPDRLAICTRLVKAAFGAGSSPG
jgi:O-acetyl-ADP-ribose deacetylase (regulator of RNase III)